MLITVIAKGMIDRDGQLPGVVHQGHPTGATPSGSRHEGRPSSARCVITAMVTLIAVPLGIAGAVYLNEYGRTRPFAGAAIPRQRDGGCSLPS